MIIRGEHHISRRVNNWKVNEETLDNQYREIVKMIIYFAFLFTRRIIHVSDLVTKTINFHFLIGKFNTLLRIENFIRSIKIFSKIGFVKFSSLVLRIAIKN